MVNYNDVLSLQYLDKQIFSGSIKGLSYRLKSTEVDGSKVLRLYFWKGPFSYDALRGADIPEKDFPFTEEGRRAAIDMINKEFNDNIDKYSYTGIY